MKIETLEFVNSEYDPLSKMDSLITYKGELEDGVEVELLIVYPKRATTNFYLRIDNRDFLSGLNSELKRHTKKGSMKDFINLKLFEHLNPKKEKKKRKRKKKKVS